MSVRDMCLIGLFAGLMVIGSQVSLPLPFTPVPVTFQDTVVMLAAVLLSARLAVGSIIVWIVLGLVGLPVFAQGKAGIAVLFGPTGGFILGFVCCAYFIAKLTKSLDLSFWRAWGAMLTGMAVVYLLGLLGFVASFAWLLQKPMTWDTAFYLAVAPFLPLGVVKSVFTAFIGVKVRQALYRAGFFFA